MSYAEKTKVGVAQSRNEIEKLLKRFGASDFGYMSSKGLAVLAFVVKSRHVRFTITVPDNEREARVKWRGMVLGIKSKLVCVDQGIFTFEEEFLPHIVTDSGKTVGEELIPRLDQVKREGPLMLLNRHRSDEPTRRP